MVEQLPGIGKITNNGANGVFEFSDDGPSHVIVDTIPKNLEDAAVEAKEGCPTEAIKDAD